MPEAKGPGERREGAQKALRGKLRSLGFLLRAADSPKRRT